MRKATVILALAGVAAGATSIATEAHGWRLFNRKERPKHFRSLSRDKSFVRVSTLANYLNNADIGDETVSEIVAATADGRTLVYTDSPGNAIGFIDITDPSNPVPTGKLPLDPDPTDEVDFYEPTSVDVLGNQYAAVGVNTSESFTNPSGHLAVVHLGSRTIAARLDLGGQPDSVRVSPDGRFIAVVIENERDEDLCVGGSDNGLEIVDEDDQLDGVNTTEDLCEDRGGVPGGLPQTPFGNPPGHLAVIPVSGDPLTWIVHQVALTGLSDYAPEDPEPEFVDINHRNKAAVTLQENNHVAIVDLETRDVAKHFGMGTVTLNGVDATEDGVISLTETLTDVPREPDAVAWVPGFWGHWNVATANEGDLFGGSRGFSIFRTNGIPTFDSGTSLEEIAVQHGHYPEARSDAKGTEPEAIAYARFWGHDYLFVGSERGSFVAVYKLDHWGRPVFDQLLPAPLGPEGLLPIPHRGLLVASGEEDDPSFGVRSTVMIYQLRHGKPTYPQILSDDSEGSPIPWSALSGMTSIPWRSDELLAVWDSFYAESHIFRIDVSERPAVITEAVTIQGGTGNYDPEGIAVAPDHTLWVASEGNASDSRPNRLLQLDLNGNVLAEIGLPQEILDCRAASASRGTLGSGFEGVAVVSSHDDWPTRRFRRGRHHPGFHPPAWGHGGYRLAVAQQRGWDYTTPECEDLDDDGGGVNALGQPLWTRIWIYDPEDGSWDYVSWELQPLSPNADWVGLSEITAVPSGYLLIERDNLTGDFGVLKTLVRVGKHTGGDNLISNAEKKFFDVRPRLTATNGWITDKPEGTAVTFDGRVYVVTDNDGVDDWSGETWFLDLGHLWELFW
jgi:hypothetical protein